MTAMLQDLKPTGHDVALYRTTTGGWQATCRCGWEGTPMRGADSHEAALAQFRSHLEGLHA